MGFGDVGDVVGNFVVGSCVGIETVGVDDVGLFVGFDDFGTFVGSEVGIVVGLSGLVPAWL